MKMETKLTDGKLEIKNLINKGFIIGLLFVGALIILAIWFIVIGISEGNFRNISIGVVGLFAMIYLVMLIPAFQNKNNYEIEFPNKDSLEGFKLKYKDKLVDVKYYIDEEGKFLFANDEDKLECVSYADDSGMSNIVKYKIVNYFMLWLKNNDLLSSKTKHTTGKQL